MVRSFEISDRELLQLHKGAMGGMSDVVRERVLRSAASRRDHWSTQLEKERDIIAMISNRKGATDYTPNHNARSERYQLERAIALSLLDMPTQPSQDATAPIGSDERVVVDLSQD